MLTALFKVFPFLWPFLKEMLLGGKNHPMFTNMKKAGWVKPIMGFLIVVIVSLGDAYLTALKEIETLKNELNVKKTSEISQQTVGLMLCERDLTRLTSDLAALKSDVSEGVYDCKEAKQKLAEIANRPTLPTVLPKVQETPESIKETQRQRALRKLGELKANEK